MHMLARSTSLSQRSKTSKKLSRICQKICTRAAMSASLNFICQFVLLHVPGCVSCDAPKSSWPRSILQVQFRGRTLGLVLTASNLGQTW